MTLVQKAAQFAAKAHSGQLRRYTNAPYFTHCEAVAHAVAAAGADEVTIAAAYLHDVLEDTDATIDELIEAFGPGIAEIVADLTNVYTKAAYPKLSRAQRKRLETERLAHISPRAKIIKRADIADNTLTIVERDPKFAAIYLPEKKAMLAVL
jgi:guanosine-3',5'-bis(diphosphate) 3'-pyrophosphohydrolase